MVLATRRVIAFTAPVAILWIMIWGQYARADKKIIKVTSEKAPVHLWADSQSVIIGQVFSGQVLNSEYKQGEWFRVNFRHSEDDIMKSGYIHQKHIEKPKDKPDKILVISGERTIPGKEKAYKGERLSLSFKDTDIRDLILFLCNIGGLNVVFDPGVAGKISCELKDVPWDQALDVILKTNRLAKITEGDVLRIGKIDDLIKHR